MAKFHKAFYFTIFGRKAFGVMAVGAFSFQLVRCPAKKIFHFYSTVSLHVGHTRIQYSRVSTNYLNPFHGPLDAPKGFKSFVKKRKNGF